jgi:hypothetical protein
MNPRHGHVLLRRFALPQSLDVYGDFGSAGSGVH